MIWLCVCDYFNYAQGLNGKGAPSEIEAGLDIRLEEIRLLINSIRLESMPDREHRAKDELGFP